MYFIFILLSTSRDNKNQPDRKILHPVFLYSIKNIHKEVFILAFTVKAKYTYLSKPKPVLLCWNFRILRQQFPQCCRHSVCKVSFIPWLFDEDSMRVR